MENNTILKFDGLSKKFGNKTVVDHISLEIKEGEIFGLLGPNGAGKKKVADIASSAIKTLCAYSLTIICFQYLRKKQRVKHNNFDSK